MKVSLKQGLLSMLCIGYLSKKGEKENDKDATKPR